MRRLCFEVIKDGQNANPFVVNSTKCCLSFNQHYEVPMRSRPWKSSCLYGGRWWWVDFVQLMGPHPKICSTSRGRTSLRCHIVMWILNQQVQTQAFLYGGWWCWVDFATVQLLKPHPKIVRLRDPRGDLLEKKAFFVWRMVYTQEPSFGLHEK